MSSLGTKLILFLTVFLATRTALSSKEGPTPACRGDEKLFRGKCVAQDECCVSGVCNAGEVFEFGGDGPGCVPCGRQNSSKRSTFVPQRRQ